LINPITHLIDVIKGKAKYGQKRSPKWKKVRKEFLAQFPTCAVCGGSKKVEVHHKIMFHVEPLRELDKSNLITLCENKKYGVTCHIFFGHLGSYRQCNKDIEDDAKIWSAKLKSAREQNKFTK
jgi:hypothetical protein